MLIYLILKSKDNIIITFKIFQPHVLGDIQLLDGEKVKELARDVTYLCPYSGPSRGVLKVTNYQLHFRPTDAATLQGTLSVPLGVVSIILV